MDTPRLHVRGLRAGAISEATFDVARGEIVGIAGITGSGREEIASALVGAISSNAQELRVDGVDVPTPLRPRSALAAGVALVPGNRGAGSAIGDFDIRENLSLPTLAQVARRGRISRRAETALAMHWIGQLDIRPRRPTRKLAALSGGNQQKVILAKWFNADPKVIVLDDPTSGVDVGARQSIYRLIRDRAAQGTAVIVASSDDEDLLSLCSRVLVMRAGRIGAELTGDEITAHALLMAHAEEASPRVDAATTTTDHGATA